MAQEIQTKRCTKCREFLPITDFYKRYNCKYGVVGTCKKCVHISQTTPEKRIRTRALAKERYEKGHWKKVSQNAKQYNRHLYLKNTYGITQEVYEKLLTSQNCKCAICKSIVDDSSKGHIDHCHKTGEIRGILCAQCNKGLGHFKDDANLLYTAIDYLKTHEGEKLLMYVKTLV